MASRARRAVISGTPGGGVLVRFGVCWCEVDPQGISLHADSTPAMITGLFAVLKLTRVTDWRWAAVTAPLWGLVLLMSVSAGIAVTVAAVLQRREEGAGG